MTRAAWTLRGWAHKHTSTQAHKHKSQHNAPEYDEHKLRKSQKKVQVKRTINLWVTIVQVQTKTFAGGARRLSMAPKSANAHEAQVSPPTQLQHPKTIPSFETSQNRYLTFVICTRWCSPSWSCSCFWGRTCRWRPLLRPRWRSASGRCPPRRPRRRWTRQGRGGSHPENEDLVSKYNDSISL